MKRIVLLIIIAALMLCGCSPIVDEMNTLDIYASFYPIYALLDGLVKDIPDIRLHCLVQPQDGCLRDYELSDWDLYLLASSADALFIAGRGLESFEGTVLNWGDNGPAVSAVLYNLDLYNQDDEASGEETSHFDGANPHLYMSVKGAKEIIENMAGALYVLDPGYANVYEDNFEKMSDRLDKLYEEIQNAFSDKQKTPVIIMNEALVYVARDYGLDVGLCWERESGTSLYANELQECLKAIKATGVERILIEKQAPDALVQALEDAGYIVAKIDILSDHGLTDGFEDYLKTQRNNAAVMCGAFS